MIKGMICPHCRKGNLNKAGISYNKDSKVQRYICTRRGCHRITTRPIKG